MANIPRYDPRDSEVLSPLMAGFSEALVKLSSVLNLNTKTITNVELEKLPWSGSAAQWKNCHHRVFRYALRRLPR